MHFWGFEVPRLCSKSGRLQDKPEGKHSRTNPRQLQGVEAKFGTNPTRSSVDMKSKSEEPSEEDILLPKHCDSYGRCIMILFKSIGVRGLF